MKAPRSSAEIERIRERIIDEALSIIVEEGFAMLTMRRLGNRLRMSAPNLYNYFKGKDEIYISIVIKGFKMLKEDLEGAYSAHEDPAMRAHALIETYVRFGITNKAYYDIMFTRPTPKYNDYVGTPHEDLSAVEYAISMDIARLAMDVLKDLRKDAPGLAEEEVVHHMVKIWSLLHGMVSLSNSNIVGYVTPETEKTYSRIMQELVEQYRA